MTTILVVDDEPSIVDTLSEILSFEGYQVSAASDGKEALQVLAASAPDVIIIDYMMPVLDGIQVLTAMETIAGCKATRAILMSAVAEPPAESRLWHAFLRKPFDIDALMTAIERASVGRTQT
jgi:CheY-like chemotaxis protein